MGLDVFAEHRSIWKGKPVLADIYAVWFDALLDTLGPSRRRVLELGAGPGFFSEYARARRPPALSLDRGGRGGGPLERRGPRRPPPAVPVRLFRYDPRRGRPASSRPAPDVLRGSGARARPRRVRGNGGALGDAALLSRLPLAASGGLTLG